MTKVKCFQHPHYDGSSNPQLSCRACCHIFVEKVKENQNKDSEKSHESAKDLALIR